MDLIQIYIYLAIKALRYAVSRRNVELVKKLLEAGANARAKDDEVRRINRYVLYHLLKNYNWL